MYFSHLGVFLISVKPSTTENNTTPKICKITVIHTMTTWCVPLLYAIVNTYKRGSTQATLRPRLRIEKNGVSQSAKLNPRVCAGACTCRIWSMLELQWTLCIFDCQLCVILAQSLVKDIRLSLRSFFCIFLFGKMTESRSMSSSPAPAVVFLCMPRRRHHRPRLHLVVYRLRSTTVSPWRMTSPLSASCQLMQIHFSVA